MLSKNFITELLYPLQNLNNSTFLMLHILQTYHASICTLPICQRIDRQILQLTSTFSDYRFPMVPILPAFKALSYAISIAYWRLRLFSRIQIWYKRSWYQFQSFPVSIMYPWFKRTEFGEPQIPSKWKSLATSPWFPTVYKTYDCHPKHKINLITHFMSQSWSPEPTFTCSSPVWRVHTVIVLLLV